MNNAKVYRSISALSKVDSSDIDMYRLIKG